MTPQELRIEKDGYALDARVEGRGQAALVIGSPTYYARSFSQNLRRTLQLAFVNWRGFVKAPKQPAALSLEVLLQDIDAMRQALGLKKVICIGHSAHALLALEYAKKYPEHTSHVVMIAMSPGLSPELYVMTEKHWENQATPERKRALAARYEASPDSQLEGLEAGERFIREYVRRDPMAWYDYDIDSSYLWEDVFVNISAFDFLYRELLPTLDVSEGLDKLKMPVLLCMGAHEHIVAPAAAWDPLLPKFHDITRVLFEKSGHSPQLEEPERFDELLLSWLSSRASTQPD